MQSTIVETHYFSDLLCIWAYLGQIRVDELRRNFGEQIQWHFHCVDVFGSVEAKMDQSWSGRGGLKGYAKHVQEIAAKFDHIDVHPELWLANTPQSSTSCHLFLKSVELLEKQGLLSDLPTKPGYSMVETLAWQMRLAFFRHAVDIGKRQEQLTIARGLNLPTAAIINGIESGEAFAQLSQDRQLAEKYRICGSPTFVLNQGRQILYGNVGYRVLEANIQELLNHNNDQASWC